jgi:nucleoside-diphosphate-sugar epimerase
MELYVGRVQAEGRLETVVIRAPWFYGPHQPPRQTEFFVMIRDGRAPLVAGGRALRSMSYTGNLAEGLLRAGTVAAAAGRTYWIADARPYAMHEVIDTVERLLETEFGQPCARRRLRLPGLVSDVAQLLDGGVQGLGLYHTKVHVLAEMNKTIACSIERARRELGYAPAVALEEGMRRSLRWITERGLLPPRRG